ncbi:MAG: hypothetical protein KDD51_11020 [Bdellovibrionales bacterium]|nr:hypothetical protein [Bdellovibrionales bacterium]
MISVRVHVVLAVGLCCWVALADRCPEVIISSATDFKGQQQLLTDTRRFVPRLFEALPDGLRAPARLDVHFVHEGYSRFRGNTVTIRSQSAEGGIGLEDADTLTHEIGHAIFAASLPSDLQEVNQTRARPIDRVLIPEKIPDNPMDTYDELFGHALNVAFLHTSRGVHFSEPAMEAVVGNCTPDVVDDMYDAMSLPSDGVISPNRWLNQWPYLEEHLFFVPALSHFWLLVRDKPLPERMRLLEVLMSAMVFDARTNIQVWRGGTFPIDNREVSQANRDLIATFNTLLSQ